MTMPAVTFCRVNHMFAHFPHEAVTPESFHGLSRHRTDSSGAPYVHHVQTPTAIPIQFSPMLVREKDLPTVRSCIASMQARKDLTRSKVAVTLDQPQLTRVEQSITKLAHDELPGRLSVVLWVLTPEPQLNPMEDSLREAPCDVLPDGFRKSLFLQEWLAEEPGRKLRGKPDWMEARGILLPEHDTLIVHGRKLLTACETMVGK